MDKSEHHWLYNVMLWKKNARLPHHIPTHLSEHIQCTCKTKIQLLEYDHALIKSEHKRLKCSSIKLDKYQTISSMQQIELFHRHIVRYELTILRLSFYLFSLTNIYGLAF